MTVIQERLAQFEAGALASGSHGASWQGVACAVEWASYLNGDTTISDSTPCVSPVLRRYAIRLNDRWDDERRQDLKPFVPRLIGTGDDGKDAARMAIATRTLCTDLLGPWLRLAGMDERADTLTALVAATPAELRRVLWDIRSEAWRVRDMHRDSLKAKILERLKDRPAVAVAVAVADAAAAAAAAADAAAVAVADAAADADADAVAVAAADAAAAAAAAAAADAVAVAVADAAADAVAVAVAVAVADAAAAAAAVAVADAAAVAVAGGGSYWPAYYAARDYFRDNPLPVMDKIRALNAEQAPLALQLLDAMIDPS